MGTTGRSVVEFSKLPRCGRTREAGAEGSLRPQLDVRDGAVRDTTREIFWLPGKEKRLVLGIVRQFVGAVRAGTHLDSAKSVDRGAAR